MINNCDDANHTVKFTSLESSQSIWKNVIRVDGVGNICDSERLVNEWLKLNQSFITKLV